MSSISRESWLCRINAQLTFVSYKEKEISIACWHSYSLLMFCKTILLPRWIRRRLIFGWIVTLSTKLLTQLFSLYEVKAAESLGITALTSKRPATVLGWIEQYLYKSVIYKRSYCFGVWKQYPLVNKVLLNWPLNSFLMWQERNSSLGLG